MRRCWARRQGRCPARSGRRCRRGCQGRRFARRARGKDADASAARGERVGGEGRGVVVPGLLGDVGERGGDDVRAAGCGEELAVGIGDGGGGELGAADAGDVLAGGWEVDGKGLFGGDVVGSAVAVSGAIVAGGGDDGLSLGGGLLEHSVQRGELGLAEGGLAFAVADVEDGRDAVLDRPGEGVEDAGGRVGADVDEVDGGAGSDASGVLGVKVGLGLVAAVDGGGAGVGDEDAGGRVGGLADGGLELGDVGVDDGGLAHDGDGDAGAGVAGVVGGLDVIDDGHVAGREEVIAGLGRGEVGLEA